MKHNTVDLNVSEPFTDAGDGTVINDRGDDVAEIIADHNTLEDDHSWIRNLEFMMNLRGVFHP